MKRRMVTVLLLGLCAAAAVCILRAQAPGVKIEDLGAWKAHKRLADVERFWALPDGRIAYSLWNPSSAARFTWALAGRIGGEKDVLPPEQHEAVELTGMNRSGTLVGTADTSGGTGRAFVVENGKVRWLPPPEHCIASWGFDVSDSGTILGAVTTQDGKWRACIWKDNRPRLLPLFDGIPAFSRAINGRDEVLLLYSKPNGAQTLNRSRPGEAPKAVETGEWRQFSLPLLNDRGDIAADATKTANPLQWSPHSLILMRNGAVTDLGRLPEASMRVRAFSSDGVIVGSAELSKQPGWPRRAFMWDTKHGIRDLNSLLPAGSGWELREAHGIDVNGAIFGIGALKGQPRFFRLTLPAGG